MPQDLLQDILASLRDDQIRRKDRFEQGIKFQEEQKVNKSNIEHQREIEKNQKEQIRQTELYHKEQQRQFDLVQKATKAFNDLKLVGEKSKITESILSGVPVAGDTQSPVSKTPEGYGFTPASGQGNTGLTHHSIPVGDESVSMTLPSPEAFAKQQGELEGLRNEPKYKQELDKIKTQEGFDQMTALINQTAQDARQSVLIKSQEKIAEGRNKVTLEAARIRAAGDSSLDKINPTSYFDRLYSGDATEKQILSEFPSAKEKFAAGRLLRAFNESGGRSLTDAQQKALSNYQSFANILGTYDNFLDIAPKVTEEGMMGTVKSQIQGIQASLREDPSVIIQRQLHGHAAELAKKIQDQGGSLSDKDVAFAIQGNLPEVKNKFTSNVRLRNGLAKTVVDKFNSDFHNIGPEQRAALMEKIGLNKVNPIYKPKVKETPAGGIRTPTKRPTLQELYNQTVGGGN